MVSKYKGGLRLMVRAVSAVTLVIGAFLVIAPDSTALVLGLKKAPRLMRLIGTADLALGIALLKSPEPSRWMLVRVYANLSLAGLYSWLLVNRTAPKPQRTLLV